MGEGTANFDPNLQIFFCLAAQGNQTLLVTLADRREPFVVQVQSSATPSPRDSAPTPRINLSG